MKTEPIWIPGPWPGRLGIVPRPRGGDWLEDEIRSWRRAGVGVALSLLTLDEATEFGLTDEAVLSRANGIRFGSFPIPDRGIPPSKEAFSELIAHLAEELATGKTVVVHCRQGIGRSGLIATGVLAMFGIDPEAAMRRVTAARGCPVPETAEQRHWILDFAKSKTAPATIVSEVGRPQSPIT